jgi:guanine deaminase
VTYTNTFHICCFVCTNSRAKKLANGTTSAAYFATVHYESSLFLADTVECLGQCAFIGKVNMNYGTPEGYGEDTYDSFICTEQYIRNIQSKRVRSQL